MTIRIVKEEDLAEILALHQLYFKEKFDFPDLKKFICGFVVLNDQNNIITFGGLRLSLEAIAVTDMKASKRDRYEALTKLFSALIFNAKAESFEGMYCTSIENETWFKQLKKYGWTEMKGQPLVFQV